MVLPCVLLAAFNLLDARVEIPRNAEPSTVLSVTELTNYVAKISGKILEVEVEGREGSGNSTVNLNLQPQPSIFIGTLKTLKDVPERVRTALANAKQYEAAWMGTEGGNLWIVGKEETADLYATYHFLEMKLGVRWFQAAIPEDPGDWYPTRKEIVIEDFAEFREPDFKYRFLLANCCRVTIIPKPGVQAAYRNGYQIRSGLDWWTWRDGPKRRDFETFYGPRMSRRCHFEGGDLLCRAAIPYEKYLDAHPEWFALQDGVRAGKKRKTWHYCLSNTNMLEAVLAYYMEKFKASGGKGIFLIGQPDNVHGWCECEECRKLDGPGEDAYGENVCIASRMCFLTNYLIPPIRKAYPEVDVQIMPYSVFRNYPTKGKFDRDISCMYCTHGRCYGHVLDDPKCVRNAKMFAHMKMWQGYLPDLWTFEYFTDTPPYYVCHERDEAADLRIFKREGFTGWLNEGMFTGSSFVPSVSKDIGEIMPSNWQWLYATGHLLWKVDQDVDALVEEAESKYYGRAFAAMGPYQKLRRDLWCSRTECMGYPSGDQRRPVLLNANGAKENLLGYLDEAEQLAGDDKVLKFRISRDRKWLETYWIKPNEKARKLAGNALRIPNLTTPVKIDGDLSDPGWLGAVYPNDRFRMGSFAEEERVAVTPELETSVGIATDGEAFYFAIDAKESAPDKMKQDAKGPDGAAWGDDGVELMLFPPSVENCYYHIAVNAAGVVYDARCPGNDKDRDLGVEAKAGRTSRGWTLEIRVPSKKLYPIVNGAKWRIQVVRNRYASGARERISFGGTPGHDTAEYPTFEIGASLVRNGTFDEVDEKGKPKGWNCYSGEVRKEGGNNVLFTKGFTSHTFTHGPLACAPVPRKLAYSFRAKGKGALKVEFVRYKDGAKGKDWMPQPWGWGGEYELTDDWKVFSGTYTINPGEHVGMAFAPPKSGCLIDDVNVTKED